MLVVASGCSDNSEQSETPRSSSGVAANKVCDGTLDASAAAALQRLSGAERFEELTGTNDAGEPNTFSVSRAVKHLHDNYSAQGTCWVYKTDDDSGRSFLEIRFSAAKSHPSSSAGESGDDTVLYPMGVYARVSGNGADLYFDCPTKATTDDAFTGDTEFVKAEMYAVAAKIQGKDVNKDRITILNSMARAVAEAAGCASTAALPTRVPEAKSG
ncbi:hypothetical protein ACIBVL_31610 [Streptomyces sp. NPDC049687]|uniref:hypothetical protein n=1 Tax=Streptomyces sp. NPDC049687 TaxID=3365596 RepID=UPI0037BC7673